MTAEKSTRVYRSTLRDRQAQETRGRVVTAAAALFSAQGFQATTMVAIAREAGVSVETVKATAPKSELLIAAFERTFSGSEGEESLTDTELGAGVLTLHGDAFVAAVIDRITVANERGHALWTVVLAAAASDPGVHAALEQILARRRDDYRMLVDVLQESGTRVADPEALAAELSFLLSPEGYQQLVTQSGWSRGQYSAWLRTAMRRALAPA